MDRGRATVVAALGAAQMLAWASTYYLPAILADPVAASLCLSRDWVFGAFSGALLLSALLGPVAGRTIDRRGGRGVLALSNVVFAAGLALLAAAQGAMGLALAWAVLGIGMGCGLYDAAFATLAALYGRDARRAITGITLIAGFASTAGWPATAFLAHAFGWRGACLAWAALHLVAGLPLNRFLVPLAAPPPLSHAVQAGASGGAGNHDATACASPSPSPPRRVLAVLAGVFAATWFVSTAMAAHLPRLLQALGVGQAAAIAAAALVGPAQVGARLVEFGVLRRISPLASARLAAVLHPLGAACVAPLGASSASAFAALHGAGSGLLTIAKGTLPLALFGADEYGLRTGLLSVPVWAMQAAAPLLFGLLLDRAGPGAALVLSSGLSLAAFGALTSLRASRGVARA